MRRALRTDQRPAQAPGANNDEGGRHVIAGDGRRDLDFFKCSSISLYLLKVLGLVQKQKRFWFVEFLKLKRIKKWVPMNLWIKMDAFAVG